MEGRRLATRKPLKGSPGARLPPMINVQESNKVFIMLWLAFKNRIHSRKICVFGSMRNDR